MSDITTINPATEQVLQHYPLMSQSEVETIIQALHHTQQAWSRTSISERIKLLEKAGKLLRENKQYHANIITAEMGKPITQSIAEVEKCANLFEYYAAEGEQFLEPELIKTQFYKSYRYFQPLGIIFAIMPWNFPYWQVMRFAVPNLLLGNAGLLKHSPNTTGTALAMEQLFIDAGFPKDLFRSLVIDVDLAPFIIKHARIAGVTLTGSNRAGQSVAKEAGEALKKLVLELGGSDPYVILADADVERAAEKCITSRLGINAGQSCISAKRLIVVEKIRKEFEALIIEKAKAYQMANPTDPNTKLGPMARKDLRDKLHEQVQRSIAKGAQCALGGTLPDQTGYFYPATVLLNITVDSPAFHEEFFGPVVCVTAAKNDEEALQFANQTDFGLGSAIFTRDLEKGEQLARDTLFAGTCAVNTFVASDARLPFGGVKQSGYGRELSREGLREFANIKTIVIEK